MEGAPVLSCCTMVPNDLYARSTLGMLSHLLSSSTYMLMRLSHSIALHCPLYPRSQLLLTNNSRAHTRACRKTNFMRSFSYKVTHNVPQYSNYSYYFGWANTIFD